jgi:hypothetical protein
LRRVIPDIAAIRGHAYLGGKIKSRGAAGMGKRQRGWVAAAFLILGAGTAGAQSNQGSLAMKITIKIDGQVIEARLADNPTARDFAALLPLTLTLADYAATEKISDLPRKLSIQDAPPGHDPSVGDIAYYAPWGNLAIYYRDFSYSAGLIPLGVIEQGGALLRQAGSMQATIERAE